MKKLFFDIQITGHHTEYISHLINYLSDNKDRDEYIFVVHPDFPTKFKTIYDKGNQIANFQWVCVPYDQVNKCISKDVIRNSFSLYKLMNHYAKQNQVNHVCLLYFNVFQLAVIFYRPSYSISGILFLQFYRMNKDSFKEKLKYVRKYFITKLYMLNPKIKRIFILNDQKTAVYLNDEFSTGIFKMLPDPIPKLTPLDNFDIYGHYNSEKHRKVFLHIGSLGDRKGTFEVIDSATCLSEENQSKVFILVVGKAENVQTEQTILDKIKYNTLNSNVQIVWDNQFVSNEMMKSLFNQSYAILMPYKNTEASSGILGHAAAANKIVIATGKGLIREIIEENNLGFLLDNVTPFEIASMIDEVLSLEVLSISENSFVEEHSPNKFAELVLHKN